MIPRARTRLLTVADDLGAIGGSEIAQLRVVEGLASAGWTVELQYVSRGDLWPRWNKVASSTQVVRASGLQRTAPLRSSLGVVEAVVGTMRSQAQVIYVHNPGDLPAALMAARVKRTPVVAHLHLPPPFRQPKWLNSLIRRADAVITPSFDAAERWAQVAQLSDDQVSVIPTGIDTGHFVPIGDAERCRAASGPWHRSRHAHDPLRRRVGPHKGPDAPPRGPRHMKDTRNLVDLRGRCGRRLRRKATRASPAARGCHLVDRRLKVAPLLAAADLVVLPSLVFETQGMVVIEAMSCGTPVVASAVGGIPETLAAFRTTWCPPGDAVALARALDRLVGSRRHSPALGADSRRWVVDNLASAGPSERCPPYWPLSGTRNKRSERAHLAEAGRRRVILSPTSCRSIRHAGSIVSVDRCSEGIRSSKDVLAPAIADRLQGASVASALGFGGDQCRRSGA